MFTSVRRCSEPITQPCRHKVSVTIKGHKFELCSISVLFLKGFSLNFNQMFSLHRQCAEPITQPCGPRSRSQLKVTCLSFAFASTPYPEPFARVSMNFRKMFTSVRLCAEPITQLCRLKVKVTIEGHQSEPCILCPLHISFTPERMYVKL